MSARRPRSKLGREWQSTRQSTRRSGSTVWDGAWAASFFILVIVIVSLGMVGINLWQNIATGRVFTALQENDPRGFYFGLGGLMAAIVAYMFAAVAQRRKGCPRRRSSASASAIRSRRFTTA